MGVTKPPMLVRTWKTTDLAFAPVLTLPRKESKSIQEPHGFSDTVKRVRLQVKCSSASRAKCAHHMYLERTKTPTRVKIWRLIEAWAALQPMSQKHESPALQM